MHHVYPCPIVTVNVLIDCAAGCTQMFMRFVPIKGKPLTVFVAEIMMDMPTLYSWYVKVV